ncbi:unnamed protein product [Cyprideis torosa]|uniref:Uncharacterized protein n=1 Tax=Cyprideis torosa TaxID=163714 RepID=A0A7R8WAA6_9CRUS|nr:unnamed protein product [Cyprideis torosa]CAG0889443.1 unnamed protein product [Cyprideis torosa]
MVGAGAAKYLGAGAATETKRLRIPGIKGGYRQGWNQTLTQLRDQTRSLYKRASKGKNQLLWEELKLKRREFRSELQKSTHELANNKDNSSQTLEDPISKPILARSPNGTRTEVLKSILYQDQPSSKARLGKRSTGSPTERAHNVDFKLWIAAQHNVDFKLWIAVQHNVDFKLWIAAQHNVDFKLWIAAQHNVDFKLWIAAQHNVDFKLWIAAQHNFSKPKRSLEAGRTPPAQASCHAGLCFSRGKQNAEELLRYLVTSGGIVTKDFLYRGIVSDANVPDEVEFSSASLTPFPWLGDKLKAVGEKPFRAESRNGPWFPQDLQTDFGSVDDQSFADLPTDFDLMSLKMRKQRDPFEIPGPPRERRSHEWYLAEKPSDRFLATTAVKHSKVTTASRAKAGGEEVRSSLRLVEQSGLDSETNQKLMDLIREADRVSSSFFNEDNFLELDEDETLSLSDDPASLTEKKVQELSRNKLQALGHDPRDDLFLEITLEDSVGSSSGSSSEEEKEVATIMAGSLKKREAGDDRDGGDAEGARTLSQMTLETDHSNLEERESRNFSEENEREFGLADSLFEEPRQNPWNNKAASTEADRSSARDTCSEEDPTERPSMEGEAKLLPPPMPPPVPPRCVPPIPPRVKKAHSEPRSDFDVEFDCTESQLPHDNPHGDGPMRQNKDEASRHSSSPRVTTSSDLSLSRCHDLPYDLEEKKGSLMSLHSDDESFPASFNPRKCVLMEAVSKFQPSRQSSARKRIPESRPREHEQPRSPPQMEKQELKQTETPMRLPNRSYTPARINNKAPTQPCTLVRQKPAERDSRAQTPAQHMEHAQSKRPPTRLQPQPPTLTAAEEAVQQRPGASHIPKRVGSSWNFDKSVEVPAEIFQIRVADQAQVKGRSSSSGLTSDGEMLACSTFNVSATEVPFGEEEGISEVSDSALNGVEIEVNEIVTSHCAEPVDEVAHQPEANQRSTPSQFLRASSMIPRPAVKKHFNPKSDGSGWNCYRSEPPSAVTSEGEHPLFTFLKTYQLEVNVDSQHTAIQEQEIDLAESFPPQMEEDVDSQYTAIQEQEIDLAESYPPQMEEDNISFSTSERSVNKVLPLARPRQCGSTVPTDFPNVKGLESDNMSDMMESNVTSSSSKTPAYIATEQHNSPQSKTPVQMSNMNISGDCSAITKVLVDASLSSSVNPLQHLKAGQQGIIGNPPTIPLRSSKFKQAKDRWQVPRKSVTPFPPQRSAGGKDIADKIAKLKRDMSGELLDIQNSVPLSSISDIPFRANVAKPVPKRRERKTQTYCRIAEKLTQTVERKCLEKKSQTSEWMMVANTSNESVSQTHVTPQTIASQALKQTCNSDLQNETFIVKKIKDHRPACTNRSRQKQFVDDTSGGNSELSKWLEDELNCSTETFDRAVMKVLQKSPTIPLHTNSEIVDAVFQEIHRSREKNNQVGEDFTELTSNKWADDRTESHDSTMELGLSSETLKILSSRKRQKLKAKKHRRGLETSNLTDIKSFDSRHGKAVTGNSHPLQMQVPGIPVPAVRKSALASNNSSVNDHPLHRQKHAFEGNALPSSTVESDDTEVPESSFNVLSTSNHDFDLGDLNIKERRNEVSVADQRIETDPAFKFQSEQQQCSGFTDTARDKSLSSLATSGSHHRLPSPSPVIFRSTLPSPERKTLNKPSPQMISLEATTVLRSQTNPCTSPKSVRTSPSVPLAAARISSRPPSCSPSVPGFAKAGPTPQEEQRENPAPESSPGSCAPVVQTAGTLVNPMECTRGKELLKHEIFELLVSLKTLFVTVEGDPWSPADDPGENDSRSKRTQAFRDRCSYEAYGLLRSLRDLRSTVQTKQNSITPFLSSNPPPPHMFSHDHIATAARNTALILRRTYGHTSSLDKLVKRKEADAHRWRPVLPSSARPSAGRMEKTKAGVRARQTQSTSRVPGPRKVSCPPLRPAKHGLVKTSVPKKSSSAKRPAIFKQPKPQQKSDSTDSKTLENVNERHDDTVVAEAKIIRAEEAREVRAVMAQLERCLLLAQSVDRRPKILESVLNDVEEAVQERRLRLLSHPLEMRGGAEASNAEVTWKTVTQRLSDLERELKESARTSRQHKIKKNSPH